MLACIVAVTSPTVERTTPGAISREGGGVPPVDVAGGVDVAGAVGEVAPAEEVAPVAPVGVFAVVAGALGARAVFDDPPPHPASTAAHTSSPTAECECLIECPAW